MKKQMLLLFISLFGCSLMAQLVNNGGAITIENGAKLYVQGDILNNSGTIDNDGTINVEGDFNNTAMVNSGTDSRIIFSGDADSDFTPGTGNYDAIHMDKLSADVVLLGELTVDDSLNFTGEDTKVYLGTNNLNLLATTVVDEADDNEYVVTDGTGSLTRAFSSSGTASFPVGDASNYSPLDSDLAGTTVGPAARLDVRVNPVVSPNIPGQATDYISRYWDVEANDMTTYNNALVGTYAMADVTGTEALVKGASYDGMEWNFYDAANGASQVMGTVNQDDVEFTGMNFFGKADLRILLQGPYSGGSMTTTLNTNNLIPFVSPYVDAPATAVSIPATATDWIKLEARDPNNVGTVLGKTSAFLLSDGSIVGLDGASLPLLKNAESTGYIAIYHRNHLPIRTPATLDLVNASPYDFTTSAGQAYENPAFTHTPMFELSAGVFGLYQANVNGDTNVNVVDFFLTKNGTSPTQIGVYSPIDVDMNSTLNVVDFFKAKVSTSPTKPAHL